MAEILTRSNKADREITLEEPEVLQASDLESLISIVGEDMVFKKANAQFVIDFRSHIRSLLESKTDDEFNNSDEAIQEMDFDDWKPTGRTRKTPEEKAADILGTLTPDQIAAAMAMAEAKKG